MLLKFAFQIIPRGDRGFPEDWQTFWARETRELHKQRAEANGPWAKRQTGLSWPAPSGDEWIINPRSGHDTTLFLWMFLWRGGRRNTSPHRHFMQALPANQISAEQCRTSGTIEHHSAKAKPKAT